jgi:hypothetical protein
LQGFAAPYNRRKKKRFHFESTPPCDQLASETEILSEHGVISYIANVFFFSAELLAVIEKKEKPMVPSVTILWRAIATVPLDVKSVPSMQIRCVIGLRLMTRNDVHRMLAV